MTQHLDPKDRTNQLVDVAMLLAAKDGWRELTHAAVARAAGVSNGLVVARLGTKAEMLRAVMRRAVAQSVTVIVAEGLAVGDKHARRANETLRALAAEHVRGA